MQLIPALYFRGACEDALKFYESCGLGRIRELRRIESDDAAWRGKVLHSEFEGPGVRLFASDGADSEPMKGCAMLLELPDSSAAAALFDKLSAGGRITVPFRVQFWGDHYGNFTDRFGVQWAVLTRRA